MCKTIALRTWLKRFLFICLNLILVLVSLVGSPAGLVQSQGLLQIYLPLIARPAHIYLPLIMKNEPRPEPPVLEPIGPFGGTFTAVASDPLNPLRAYAGSFTNGILRTDDAGDSWAYVNNGLPLLSIQSLAVDPRQAGRVYAGSYGKGIFRSDDYGMNWRGVNSGGLGDKIIYDIEIDPRNNNIVYATSRAEHSITGYLYKSTSGGQSWSLIQSLADDYSYDIDIAPWDSKILFIAYHNRTGYMRSTDGGQSFQLINANLSMPEPWQLALDPLQPGLVYGGHKEDRFLEHSAYVSYNSGALWQRSPIDTQVKALDLASQDAPYMRVLAGTFNNGVYISDDRGNRWTQRGLTGMWVNDLAVAEGSPQVWYAAEQNRGIFKSEDYGGSWLGSQALRNTVISGVVQLTDGRLVAAVFGQGVLQSQDGGKTWENYFGETVPKTVLSLYGEGSEIYASTLEGVYQLDESTRYLLPAASMASLPEGLSLETARNYAIAPESLALELEKGAEGLRKLSRPLQDFAHFVRSGEMLYAGSLSDGVWRFDGQEWLQLGAAGKTVTALVIDPLGTVTAGACEMETCTVLRLTNSSNLDAGAGLQGERVNALLQNRGSLLAGTASGVYRWNETGAVWQVFALGGRAVFALAQDEGNPYSLAAGGKAEVYLSQDCGATWEAVSSPDPNALFSTLSYGFDRILAGTKGQGLYQIITSALN